MVKVTLELCYLLRLLTCRPKEYIVVVPKETQQKDKHNEGEDALEWTGENQLDEKDEFIFQMSENDNTLQSQIDRLHDILNEVNSKDKFEDGEKGKHEKVEQDALDQLEKNLLKDKFEDGDEEKSEQSEQLWMRRPEDVTNEEYASFYRSLSNGWEYHLSVKHFGVEGQLELRAMLFMPRRAPFDLSKNKNRKNNIKLYVRRTFVMDVGDELMPDWLNFITGIVDSENLPLNISRDTMQQNRIVRDIRRKLVEQCVEMIAEIAKKKVDHNNFFEQFGKFLKLGIREDCTNRTKLAELLRYHSSESGDEQISLKQYVDRTKECPAGNLLHHR